MAGSPADIAIVGIAGCYAGARDAGAFWQNILDKVDAVAAADAEWTGPYLDPDSQRNDRIYTNKGGFLGDLAEFNSADFGIMPSSVDGGEPDHYLALKLARDALRDAGYDNGGFDPERAGVILGRGTYINRGYTTLMQHGMAVDQTLDALRVARPDLSAADLEKVRDALKAQLPGFNAEMSPGLVPNVTTGIIANRLNLMGPNYIIDAACASSLISVELAVRELHSGRCDLVLAGGVQAHTPPQLFMIFCQLGALTRGNIRPFSANAGGTLLGEGAGLLVLKRLADAEADGDRIYAVIKGMGTSSDGRAKGLLAPRLEGEVLALRRAYRASGIDPRTVGLVEAHGTGIKLGDQTELQSLGEVYGARQCTAPRVALGSVKSMISHCIPAAGSAAMIKASLALHHKVLPPTLCDEINPELRLERTPFYINTETRPWVHGGEVPRRAGVNAFGFGGINAHCVLEEYRPTASVSQVAVPRQWHGPTRELFCFAAADRDALLAQIDTLRARLDAPPTPALAALAKAQAELAEAAQEAGEAGHRLACSASDIAELDKQLAKARERLEAGKERFHTRGGLHAGTGAPAGKLAFVFPGEGAQYPGMLSDLAVAYPAVREWFDFLDQTFEGVRDYRPSESILPPPSGLDARQREELENRLYGMDLGSESVFVASQALHGLLETLGITPEIMLGHSTGENSALVASNTMRARDRDALSRIAFDLNRIYRQLEADGAIRTGSLLTVGALDAAARSEALGDLDARLILAMDNCPNQAVYFGAEDDVAKAQQQLSAAGGICAMLPFGRAYHTPHFEPVAQAFRTFYQDVEMGPGSATLYSCSTMAPFPEDADAIRDTACGQWARPVRFAETVQRLYEDGVRIFVEVGPSANLTAFIGDSLRARKDVLAVATNSRRQPDVRQFHDALAQLWAAGVPMRPQALFAHRHVEPAALAVPKEAPKPRRYLDLHLPALKLREDMLPPMPVASAPAAAEAEAEPVRADNAPPAEPDVPAVAEDPRADWVRSHFSLMQQFLQSQQRVWAAASGQPAADVASAPVADTEAASDGIDVAYPLLGDIVEQSADRLVMRRVYRLDRDRFLQDHTIGGGPSERDPSLLPIPVIPFTFSMEILAEAAARLIGPGARFIGMDVSRGHRWLSLDDETLPARIVVERAPGGGASQEVQGRIFLERPGGKIRGGVLVFEATLRFAQAYAEAPAVMQWGEAPAYPARNNPDGQLYAHGMFHGPRLQGVKRILRWADEAIEAELEVIPTDDYFSFTHTPRFQFDAALLDAAGQLAGYWLTEKHSWGFNCFPFRLGRFRVFAATPPAGTRVRCIGKLRMTGEQTLEAAFDLVLPDGRLLARAEGWEDRKFAVPQHLYDYRLAPTERYLSKAAAMPAPEGWCLRHVEAFPDHFLDEGWGIWKHMLAHMALSKSERVHYYRLPASGPRREEWLLGRVAAKEAAREWIARHYGLRLANADIEVRSDDNGAPSASSAYLEGRPAPALSIAHSRGHALACAVPPGLAPGLDYQRREHIRIEDVASGALSDADLAAVGGRRDDAAVLALWCAKEAAAKVLRLGLLGRPQSWQVVAATLDARGNGSVTIAHGTAQVAVLVARVEEEAFMALGASTAHGADTAPAEATRAAATVH